MSDENKDLMEQFMKLEGLLHRYLMFNLRNHGPFGNPHRGQGRVLSILKMKPELSQKELGYLLDMRNQSLGELLNKLEKSGYITRTPSEEDRRTTNIRLTPEGEEAASAADEAKHEDDIFSSLNEEEQAQLSSYLDKIIAKLEALFTGAEQDMQDFGEHMRGWFGQYAGRYRGFGPHPDIAHLKQMRNAWGYRDPRHGSPAHNHQERNHSEQSRQEYRRSEHGHPEYNKSEYNKSEHGSPEYNRPGYNRPEHSNPEHNRPEYNKPEHSSPEHKDEFKDE